MAATLLTCPSCGAVAPYDSLNFLRYHCDSCGLTTVSEDLVSEKRVELLRGGASGPTVLLATYAWGSDPVTMGFSDSSDGGGSITSVLTAAGAQDGSDTTYEEITSTDIGGIQGETTAYLFQSVSLVSGSASGTISYLRFKYRGSRSNSGSGRITPAIFTSGGAIVQQLPDTTLTTIIQNYSQDRTNDPSGSAWTFSGIASRYFGFFLVAAGNLSTTTARCQEFTLEVWGTR